MITIDLVCQYKKWLQIPQIEDKVTEICLKLLPLTNLKKILDRNIHIELTVMLVGSAKMKNINFKYRQKNYSTDVLSFPVASEELIKNGNLKNLPLYDNYLFLGDIICCFEVVKKESIEQNKDFFAHLTHLILHSILHLIGYNHEKPDDAIIMEKTEIKILSKLNIANPFIKFIN